MRLTSILFKAKNWSNQFSNLPESYIKRASEQVYWRNPKGPQYKPNAEIKRKEFRYTSHRPWTAQFRQHNAPGARHKKVWVEPIKEWSFFRGDRVEVLVGRDKGKQGIVNQIVQERNWVYVEGLNCHLRTLGKKTDSQGVVVRSEAPLLVTTQVALVDPSDLKPTPFEWRFTDDGNKVRVSTRTGRLIPIPATNEQTMDYKSRAAYKEQPKDTVSADLDKITFEPKLCTFEMDLMERYGIKEDRVPPKSYWY